MTAARSPPRSAPHPARRTEPWTSGFRGRARRCRDSARAHPRNRARHRLSPVGEPGVRQLSCVKGGRSSVPCACHWALNAGARGRRAPAVPGVSLRRNARGTFPSHQAERRPPPGPRLPEPSRMAHGLRGCNRRTPRRDRHPIPFGWQGGAGHRRLGRHRRRRGARAACAGRHGGAVWHPHGRAGRAGGGTRRPRPCLPCGPARPSRARGTGRSGGSRGRPAGHPGQQRRPHPRHAGAADAATNCGRPCWTWT